jgi:hypothetical protein
VATVPATDRMRSRNSVLEPTREISTARLYSSLSLSLSLSLAPVFILLPSPVQGTPEFNGLHRKVKLPRSFVTVGRLLVSSTPPPSAAPPHLVNKTHTLSATANRSSLHFTSTVSAETLEQQHCPVCFCTEPVLCALAPWCKNVARRVWQQEYMKRQ